MTVTAVMQIVDRLVQARRAGMPIDIARIISDVSKEHHLARLPRLTDIIAAIPAKYQDIIHAIRAKPVRSASGVSVIAVMCRLHRCPHIALTGNICVYCPGGPDSEFEYSTQSYTGYEPTSMRAIRNRYDPYMQSRTRLRQLMAMGHVPDKIEFIIMGGTFLSLPARYKQWFVMKLHDSLSGHCSSTLDEAIAMGERARTKCIGITIETRPDHCFRPHISEMLSYGCTRVEIGVQSIYEDVARDTNRGHTVRAVTFAFRLAKDSGYKVVSHMMPNLPNVDRQRDYAQFQEFFGNECFRSDGLKIYPTLVIRGTGLYELWRNGLYRTYSPNELVDFLARILVLVPPWTRVYRVQRDIPMPLVSSGVEHGNIRELAMARVREYGGRCRDVRSREAGIRRIADRAVPDEIVLVRRDYAASNGWETFLSLEDVQEDILVGLLRIRKCSTDTFRKELMTGNGRTDGHTGGSRWDEVMHRRTVHTNDRSIDRSIDNGNRSIDDNGNNDNIRSIDGSTNMNINNQYININNQYINDINNTNTNINTSSISSRSLPDDLLVRIDSVPPFDYSGQCSTTQIRNDNVSIIRELHVYGTAVPVDKQKHGCYQHRGYGGMLIAEAERIARDEHLSVKMAIISGVGTRRYYEKFGYSLEGPYMVKSLID